MRFGLKPLRAVIGAGVLAVTVGHAHAQLPQLDLENVSSGLSLPLAFVQDPQDASVQFIVQQRGRIRVVVDGVLQGTDFMDLNSIVDINSNEGGLLGLAFPPDPNDDRFYVYYTDRSDDTRIVRYTRMAGNPLQGDPSSAEQLIFVDQPFTNHNGGWLAFGPDGYLYAGLGDGGSGGDPGNRAQTISTLLGKMIRIDVSPVTGYDIPADNPFVDDDPVDALEEIWAFGLRNPWRYSFDNPAFGGTGAMLIADVGQNAWEEVNFEPPGEGGRNYGWRIREGAHNFNTSLPPAYTPLIDPIWEVAHPTGGSITGGFVYRGNKLGNVYRGRYFVADFVTRRLWSFDLDQSGSGSASDTVEHTADLGGSTTLGNMSSFGEDASGELYIVSFNGTVRRIVPSETTDIVSITENWGTIASGGIPELLESDDEYLVVNSQFGFAATVANLNEIEIEANTTASGDPAFMDLIVECRVNNPGGTGEISFQNVNNQNWVNRGNYAPGTTEQVFRFDNIANPNRWVANNGDIKMRSRHVVITTFAATGFISFYDQICIVVRD